MKSDFRHDPDVPTRTLIPFLILAFGLTWGLAGLLVLFPTRLEAVFGPLSYTNPLFILAVYSPGIAGLLLVGRHGGLRGLGRYLRRLTIWRMPLGWWIIVAVGIPIIYYAGAAVNGTALDPLPFESLWELLPALLATLFIGPIEEFGWRGLALPLLQRNMAPIWAGLLLGVIWATWHIPAFLLSGTPQSSWSFPAFFLGVVSLSMLITPMFNASQGSLLVAALVHFQANGPMWPDAQPWDAPLFALAACLAVWVAREEMFGGEKAVTAVIPRRVPVLEGAMDEVAVIDPLKGGAVMDRGGAP